jgi:hypothetical protein
MESQTSLATLVTSFFTRTEKRPQMIYYQYSVTLPLYGMQPTERAIFNSLVILSLFISIPLAFYVVRLGVRLMSVLIWKAGGL